jgi:NTE family protein
MEHVLVNVARDLGREVRLDVLCGTSVGALNACGLAAFADLGRDAIGPVVDVWTKLRVADLVRPDTRGILNMGARLLGRGDPLDDLAPVREGGLVDLARLETINRILAAGSRAYGAGFVSTLSAEMGSPGARACAP